MNNTVTAKHIVSLFLSILIILNTLFIVNAEVEPFGMENYGATDRNYAQDKAILDYENSMTSVRDIRVPVDEVLDKQKLLTSKNSINNASKNEIEENKLNFDQIKVINESAFNSEIYEIEPNNSTSTANILTLPSSLSETNSFWIYGSITNVYYDLDYYKIVLPQSGTLSAAGFWIGEYYNYGWEEDLYLCVLDSQGNFIAVSNDYGYYTGLNIAVNQGTYYLLVLASDDFGNLYVNEPYGVLFDYYPNGPIISSVTANKSSPVIPGTTITWTSNATGTGLTYYWRVYKDGVQVYSDTAYSSSKKSFSYKADKLGTYTARSYVRDQGNLMTYKNAAAIKVEHAPAPIINSVTANKSSPVIPGTTITWTSNATGTGLTYYWRVYKDGVQVYSDTAYSSSKKSFSYKADKLGTYTARSYVRDYTLTRMVYKNSAAIEVKDAPAPVINSVTANKSSPVIPGTTITWTSNATGTGLTYYWRVYKDGVQIYSDTAYSSSKKSFSYKADKLGTYTARSYVRDYKSRMVYKNAAAIKVEDAPAPIINSVTANKSSPVIPGTTITWTSNATGTGLTYYWRVYKDGVQVHSDTSYSSSKKSFSYKADKLGTYTARSYVRDYKSRMVYKNAAAIIVEDAPAPVINSVTSSLNGTTITWTSNATGTDLTYYWRVYKDGIQIYSDTTYSTSMRNFSYKAIETGIYTARSYVRDYTWTRMVYKDSEATNIITTVDTSGPVYEGNYLIISNESTSIDNYQYSGTLPIINDPVIMPSKSEESLDRNSYRLNPIIPFDKSELTDGLINKSMGSLNTSSVIGESRLFRTLNMSNGLYENTNAKLLYNGQYCEVWVENENVVNSTAAASMGIEFDNVIYPLMISNFGNHTDVNQDGKIALLIFDINDGYNGYGSYVGGYFSSRDLFPVINSNQMEILYIDTYPSMQLSGGQVDPTAAYSTIVHELQHLINYSAKGYSSSYAMDLWINEGMSMAAQHLYLNSTLDSRINYFNYSPAVLSGQSVLDWSDAQSSDQRLASYSLSYLFMQYIKTQSGRGAAIYKEMLASPYADYRAVENIVKNYIDNSMTFGSLMTNFRIALVANESSGKYGFNNESGFDAIIPRVYQGTGTSISGGGALTIQIPESYTSSGDAGSNIRYAGVN